MRRFLGAVLLTMMLTVSGCSEQTEAPAFTLNSLSGQSVSLNDYRGRPVVINFWQLSCPPCIEELPYFQGALGASGDAVILTIAIRDSAASLNSFMQANSYSFPVLLDGITAVAASYDVRFTPTTVFIDRQGRIVETKVGPFSSTAELLQKLRNIV